MSDHTVAEAEDSYVVTLDVATGEISTAPFRPILTDAQRMEIRAAGDHAPDMCDCYDTDLPPTDANSCDALLDTFAVVERLIAEATS